MNNPEFGPSPEYKEEDVARLKQKIERFMKKPNGRMDHKRYEAMADRIAHLRTLYPDYHTYAAYHIAVFSTTTSPPAHFDFPGNDSIELYIDTWQEQGQGA